MHFKKTLLKFVLRVPPRNGWLIAASSFALLLSGLSLYALNPGEPNFLSREAAVNAVIQSSTVFDCTIEDAPKQTTSPVVTDLLELRNDTALSIDGKAFTAAVWSPRADALVFVAPTEQIRALPSDTSALAQGSSHVVGVSVNELWYYNLHRHVWRRITDDGASPRFSTDGRLVYFLSGANLMAFDIYKLSVAPVNRKIPDTRPSLLLSRPLSDGTLFAPSDTQRFSLTSPKPRLLQLDLRETDHVSISPANDVIAVSYTGSEKIPPVTTVISQDGAIRPLLRNCPYSATQLSWSRGGEIIAYPLSGREPVIHLVDRTTNARSVISLPGGGRISSLSLSPDSFIAFAQDGGSNTSDISIYVITRDGRRIQRLTEGMMPQWSPDGRYIVYASVASGSWRLAEVEVH